MTSRYMNPRGMGTYVISSAHTWLLRTILRLCKKYEYLYLAGSMTEVRGLQYMVFMRMMRISDRALSLSALKPIRSRALDMRRVPRGLDPPNIAGPWHA